MGKIAIVFEVPDGTDYAEVADRMIAHQAFARGKLMGYWSFDLEMRPVGALVAEVSPELAEAIRQARASIDQDHPWIPGGVFADDPGLKGLLLAFLDTMTRD
jgi:hypothetical protein